MTRSAKIQDLRSLTFDEIRAVSGGGAGNGTGIYGAGNGTGIYGAGNGTGRK